MSDTPDRIWIYEGKVAWVQLPELGMRIRFEGQQGFDGEYVHASLHDPEQFNFAYAKQAERIQELEELVRDCMEDETEFDTPWDKKARRLLGLSEAPEDG